MRAVFDPATLSAIEVEGTLAGCIGCTPHPDHVEVHSFYLDPAAQGRGLGTAVLAAALAPHAGLPVRIEVLKGAPVHRFWERQGFVRSGEQDFDWLYERPGR
nr:GNAT family N-acetyltransferase [Neoroseomonas nitratireducens]